MNIATKQLQDSRFILDIRNMKLLKFLAIDKFHVDASAKGLDVECEVEPFSFGCITMEPIEKKKKIELEIKIN